MIIIKFKAKGHKARLFYSILDNIIGKHQFCDIVRSNKLY